MSDNKTAKLKEVCEKTKTRLSTIRYYSHLGLLPFEQKEPRLARHYDLDKVEKRLDEIKSLKEKGFKIPDLIERFKGK